MYKPAKHYAKKPSHETIFTAFSQFPLLSQRQPQYYQPAATERQQEGSLVMVRDGASAAEKFDLPGKTSNMSIPA